MASSSSSAPSPLPLRGNGVNRGAASAYKTTEVTLRASDVAAAIGADEYRSREKILSSLVDETVGSEEELTAEEKTLVEAIHTTDDFSMLEEGILAAREAAAVAVTAAMAAATATVTPPTSVASPINLFDQPKAPGKTPPLAAMAAAVTATAVTATAVTATAVTATAVTATAVGPTALTPSIVAASLPSYSSPSEAKSRIELIEKAARQNVGKVNESWALNEYERREGVKVTRRNDKVYTLIISESPRIAVRGMVDGVIEAEEDASDASENSTVVEVKNRTREANIHESIAEISMREKVQLLTYMKMLGLRNGILLEAITTGGGIRIKAHPFPFDESAWAYVQEYLVSFGKDVIKKRTQQIFSPVEAFLGGEDIAEVAETTEPAETTESAEVADPSEEVDGASTDARNTSSAASASDAASASGAASAPSAAGSPTKASRPLTPQQRAIFALIQKGKTLCITGEAGTGKSFLLNRIHLYCEKNGIPHAMTALTGAAAALISGRTFHSWAGIGLGEGSVRDITTKMSRVAIERWREVRLLVIDEISMMSRGLFEKVEEIARVVRHGNTISGAPAPTAASSSSVFFGGVQVVFCGDFFQLEPIEKGGSPEFCFESPLWKHVLCNEETHLKTHIRQVDGSFQKILHEVRIARLSKETKAALLSRVMSPPAKGKIKPTVLYPYRRDVDAINQAELRKLGKTIITSTAKDVAPFGAKKADTTAATFDRLFPTVPKTLDLCVGAQVMVVCNISDSLKTGTRAVVVSFDGPENKPVIELKDGTQSTLSLHPFRTDNHYTRKQYPLILAWAMTIHKCQGATIDGMVADLKGCFANAQTYVALSRVRNFEGLYLEGIDFSKITCNPKVLKAFGEGSSGPASAAVGKGK